MVDTKKYIQEMTEEDFDGFPVIKISCRGCSGYGNCGYKKYGLYQGKVVSICQRTKKMLACERDGIPFEE